jgi:hypothetical protein
MADLNVLLGTTVRLQNVARELNPDPETLTTVPLVPVVGVTEIFGRTPKAAVALSLVGEPTTLTIQSTFAVAVGPTTKLPVATPELMEQL